VLLIFWADRLTANLLRCANGQVAGEAAGYGLGLLFVGTASEKTFEMLAYAHDTQHEKIIRGVAMGLALIMYGRCARRPEQRHGSPTQANSVQLLICQVHTIEGCSCPGAAGSGSYYRTVFAQLQMCALRLE